MAGSYKINDRRQRPNCDCGKALTETQAFYCSADCRNLYGSQSLSSSDGARYDSERIPEPKTPGEVEDMYETIEKAKAKLQTHEKELIKSQTPEDDSPEAEIRLRRMLCPHPLYSLTNYSYEHKSRK